MSFLCVFSSLRRSQKLNPEAICDSRATGFRPPALWRRRNGRLSVPLASGPGQPLADFAVQRVEGLRGGRGDGGQAVGTDS